MVDMAIGQLAAWAFILGIMVVSGFVIYGITFDRADGSKRINVSKPASIFILLVACIIFVGTLLSTIFLIIFLMDIS
jgi:hypothetical protein